MTNIDRALIRAFQGGSSSSAVPNLQRAQPVMERVVKFPRISATTLLPSSPADESTPRNEAIRHNEVASYNDAASQDEMTSHNETVQHNDPIAHETESSSGWQVDRLAWPTVVKDLLQTAADSVEQFVCFLRENPSRRHVVAITSCHRGEGRTTMACVLARQAAQLGLNVALVDADRANPGLSSALGLLAPSGWTESPEDLGRVSIHSLEEQLTVVPLANSAGLQGWQPARLVRALRQDFELVVIDAPMVSEVDAAEWSEANDASLCWIVVRDARVSNDVDVRRAQNQMLADGLAVLGVARNFAA